MKYTRLLVGFAAYGPSLRILATPLKMQNVFTYQSHLHSSFFCEQTFNQGRSQGVIIDMLDPPNEEAYSFKNSGFCA